MFRFNNVLKRLTLWVLLCLAALMVSPGGEPTPVRASAVEAESEIDTPGPNAPAGQDLSEDGIWREVGLLGVALRDQGSRQIIPDKYRLVAADINALDNLLAQAPLENSLAAQGAEVVMSLPMPDGGFQRFKIQEYLMMEPALAAKFPEIKTYLGWGIDDTTATIRLDRTPAGFHGLILSGGATVYIDPYSREDITHYMSYYKHDYGNFWGKTRGEQAPLDETAGQEGPASQDITAAAASGPLLRTYSLALAATGEYTAFHGGTVGGALAAINTTMNRVNGIYERELSIRMTLIANNNSIIYTDGGSDPYTNNNGVTMLTENQNNVTAVIGSANFDIGHVFSTGGGGVATLQSPCNDGIKARGVTGSGAPVGDPFDVDYVAHEMGHQFGANHTFNADGQFSCGGGNRNDTTAYEPGGGTTIMAYAGICGSQDVQSNSDDHFHGASFDEIIAFVGNPATGGSCASTTATGNIAPSVEAGPTYTIPKQTPFTLQGSATDPGDPLTYNWEQFDLGPAWTDLPTLPNVDSAGNAVPIFRSFSSASSSARTFPVLANILDGSHQNNGESLPNIDRTLTFRLTARDNKGGVANDSTTLTVEDGAGPFAVTDPNSAVTWTGLAAETVTWDVAGTTAAPVSCANVNIRLSTDGGLTFPLSLATNTANDGTEIVFAPADSGTTTARVKVECAGNIFFDISNTNFTLTDVAGPNLTITKTAAPGGSADPGDPVTFTIVVANSGTGDATGVQVVDTLPAEVIGTNLDTTTTITAGQSVTFTINATIDPGVTAGTVIINTASYSYTFGSNQASASFTVGVEPGNKIYLPAILKN